MAENEGTVRIDVSGRKYVDLTPTPEGFAKIVYTLIESGDAEGKKVALEEMTRLFRVALECKVD